MLCHHQVMVTMELLGNCQEHDHQSYLGKYPECCTSLIFPHVGKSGGSSQNGRRWRPPLGPREGKKGLCPHPLHGGLHARANGYTQTVKKKVDAQRETTPREKQLQARTKPTPTQQHICKTYDKMACTTLDPYRAHRSSLYPWKQLRNQKNACTIMILTLGGQWRA